MIKSMFSSHPIFSIYLQAVFVMMFCYEVKLYLNNVGQEFHCLKHNDKSSKADKILGTPCAELQLLLNIYKRIVHGFLRHCVDIQKRSS